MGNECWIFLQYTTSDRRVYPTLPFEIKVFSDFDEMKRYSAQQYSFYKEIYPDTYCSTYTRVENL